MNIIAKTFNNADIWYAEITPSIVLLVAVYFVVLHDHVLTSS